MRIRANDVDWDNLPDEVAYFAREDQTFTTVGREYVVLAISVYRGVWFALIADDHNIAEFLPLHLFTQVSMDIPPEWICSMNPGPDIAMVLGPDFVAKDERAYGSIVDKEPRAIDALWRFYEVLLERERAELSNADDESPS